MTEISKEEWDRYIAEEKRLKEWHAWCARMNVHMPAICARVFALRGTGYRGSGTHYAMEAELGYVLAKLNTMDRPAISTTIIARVRLEALLRDLIRAEFSVRGWDFP